MKIIKECTRCHIELVCDPKDIKKQVEITTEDEMRYPTKMENGICSVNPTKTGKKIKYKYIRLCLKCPICKDTIILNGKRERLK